MKNKIKKNKELFCYSLILMFLIIGVILNNVFWKLGKENINKSSNNSYLKSNNVIYNVPYEERALD